MNGAAINTTMTQIQEHSKLRIHPDTVRVFNKHLRTRIEDLVDFGLNIHIIHSWTLCIRAIGRERRHELPFFLPCVALGSHNATADEESADGLVDMLIVCYEDYEALNPTVTNMSAMSHWHIPPPAPLVCVEPNPGPTTKMALCTKWPDASFKTTQSGPAHSPMFRVTAEIEVHGETLVTNSRGPVKKATEDQAATNLETRINEFLSSLPADLPHTPHARLPPFSNYPPLATATVPATEYVSASPAPPSSDLAQLQLRVTELELLVNSLLDGFSAARQASAGRRAHAERGNTFYSKKAAAAAYNAGAGPWSNRFAALRKAAEDVAERVGSEKLPDYPLWVEVKEHMRKRRKAAKVSTPQGKLARAVVSMWLGPDELSSEYFMGSQANSVLPGPAAPTAPVPGEKPKAPRPSAAPKGRRDEDVPASAPIPTARPKREAPEQVPAWKQRRIKWLQACESNMIKLQPYQRYKYMLRSVFTLREMAKAAEKLGDPVLAEMLDVLRNSTDNHEEFLAACAAQYSDDYVQADLDSLLSTYKSDVLASFAEKHGGLPGYRRLLIAEGIEPNPGPRRFTEIGSPDAPLVFMASTAPTAAERASETAFSVSGGTGRVVSVPAQLVPEDKGAGNLSALVPRYGLYGGPGYSAGRTDLDSAQTLSVSNKVPPQDALDALYRLHDIAYATAGGNADRNKADEALAQGIDRLQDSDFPNAMAHAYARLSKLAFKGMAAARRLDLIQGVQAEKVKRANLPLSAFTGQLSTQPVANPQAVAFGKQSTTSNADSADQASVNGDAHTLNGNILRHDSWAYVGFVLAPLAFMIWHSCRYHVDSGYAAAAQASHNAAMHTQNGNTTDGVAMMLKVWNETWQKGTFEKTLMAPNTNKLSIANAARAIIRACQTINPQTTYGPATLATLEGMVYYIRAYNQFSAGTRQMSAYRAVEMLSPYFAKLVMGAHVLTPLANATLQLGLTYMKNVSTATRFQVPVKIAEQYQALVQAYAQVGMPAVNAVREAANFGALQAGGWTTRMQEDANNIVAVGVNWISFFLRLRLMEMQLTLPGVDWLPGFVQEKQYAIDNFAPSVSAWSPNFQVDTDSNPTVPNVMNVALMTITDYAAFWSSIQQQFYADASYQAPFAGYARRFGVAAVPRAYAFDRSPISANQTRTELIMLICALMRGPVVGVSYEGGLTPPIGVVTENFFYHNANWTSIDGLTDLVIIVPGPSAVGVADVASQYTAADGTPLYLWYPGKGANIYEVRDLVQQWFRTGSITAQDFQAFRHDYAIRFGCGESDQVAGWYASLMTQRYSTIAPSFGYQGDGADDVVDDTAEPNFGSDIDPGGFFFVSPTGHQFDTTCEADGLNRPLPRFGLEIRLPAEPDMRWWMALIGLVSPVSPTMIDPLERDPLMVFERIMDRVRGQILGYAGSSLHAQLSLGDDSADISFAGTCPQPLIVSLLANIWSGSRLDLPIVTRAVKHMTGLELGPIFEHVRAVQERWANPSTGDLIFATDYNSQSGCPVLHDQVYLSPVDNLCMSPTVALAWVEDGKQPDLANSPMENTTLFPPKVGFAAVAQYGTSTPKSSPIKPVKGLTFDNVVYDTRLKCSALWGAKWVRTTRGQAAVVEQVYSTYSVSPWLPNNPNEVASSFWPAPPGSYPIVSPVCYDFASQAWRIETKSTGDIDYDPTASFALFSSKGKVPCNVASQTSQFAVNSPFVPQVTDSFLDILEHYGTATEELSTTAPASQPVPPTTGGIKPPTPTSGAAPTMVGGQA